MAQKILNPSMVWVSHPECFEESFERSYDKHRKKMRILKLLDEANRRGIPIALSARKSSREYGMTKKIVETYHPIYGENRDYGPILRNLKQGVVLHCGAHIRHSFLDNFDMCRIPKNYTTNEDPENYEFATEAYNQDGNTLLPIGACVSNCVRLVSIANWEKEINLEAVVDSRVTLATDGPIIPNSFYRMDRYLMSRFLASVEPAYPIFEGFRYSE